METVSKALFMSIVINSVSNGRGLWLKPSSMCLVGFVFLLLVFF